MITPAYSPTATERVLPRLALDFTTGVLDSRVTVTRALNTATRIDSSGLMVGVNANLPRFDYDPATLAPRGLLIEESRINVVLYAEDLSNAVWKTNFSGGVTVQTNQANGPDGLQNLDRATSSATAGSLYQIFTLAFSTAHSVSMFIRQGTAATSQVAVFNTVAGTFVSVNFTWTGGVPSTSATTGAPTNIRYENFGGGLYRVSYTFTSRASGDHWLLYAPDTTAGLGTGLVGYVQLEVGAFATSYIPTVAASVTRNGDQVSMTGTNFSDWYTPSVGTLLARGAGQVAFNNMLVSMNNGTVTDELILGGSSSRASAFATASSVTQIFSQPVSVTANVPYSVALAYATNSAIAAANATLGVLDSTFTAPTVNRLDIGYYRGANTYLNGPVERIFYYTPRLLAAETQAISK